MRPGQDEFFTSLYRRYFNQIKLYALGFVSDPHHAEEIAQDTFHTALEKIDDLMGAEEPIRWLKKTAKNKICNAQRIRQRYLKHFLSLDDDSAPEVGSQESAENLVIKQEEETQRISVEETIQKTLTPEEVALLRRAVLGNVHYLEVAQELGISLWTCQKRIQRIKNKLRIKFPQYKKERKF